MPRLGTIPCTNLAVIKVGLSFPSNNKHLKEQYSNDHHVFRATELVELSPREQFSQQPPSLVYFLNMNSVSNYSAVYSITQKQIFLQELFSA